MAIDGGRHYVTCAVARRSVVGQRISLEAGVSLCIAVDRLSRQHSLSTVVSERTKKIWISLWTILSTKINWMNSDHERLRLRRGILLSSITVDENYLWRKHWKLRRPLIATWRYFWLKISQSERSVLKTLAYLKKNMCNALQGGPKTGTRFCTP